MIVTVAVFGNPNSVPLLALFKLTMTVSSFSTSLSSVMSIVKVLSTASPFAQFRVPDVAM
ncbi:hypothetical protein THIOM_002091 [Candidatus Thiomargarita nelsonii]|uniref:Uncharacterized protein n=1 Tax=Candidatus Thiomargarita nelsonii TaxID=1003181 RepID=A0A176S280_9GAMM|nr:hypothetical protein THIOM_002091 [Candidatus Thiomargarita nelsonii]